MADSPSAQRILANRLNVHAGVIEIHRHDTTVLPRDKSTRTTNGSIPDDKVFLRSDTPDDAAVKYGDVPTINTPEFPMRWIQSIGIVLFVHFVG